jgi:hypothetical protein
MLTGVGITFFEMLIFNLFSSYLVGMMGKDFKNSCKVFTSPWPWVLWESGAYLAPLHANPYSGKACGFRLYLTTEACVILLR